MDAHRIGLYCMTEKESLVRGIRFDTGFARQDGKCRSNLTMMPNFWSMMRKLMAITTIPTEIEGGVAKIGLLGLPTSLDWERLISVEFRQWRSPALARNETPESGLIEGRESHT